MILMISLTGRNERVKLKGILWFLVEEKSVERGSIIVGLGKNRIVWKKMI